MKFKDYLNSLNNSDKKSKKIQKRIRKKIEKDPNEFIIDIPAGKMKAPKNNTNQFFENE